MFAIRQSTSAAERARSNTSGSRIQSDRRSSYRPPRRSAQAQQSVPWLPNWKSRSFPGASSDPQSMQWVSWSASSRCIFVPPGSRCSRATATGPSWVVASSTHLPIFACHREQPAMASHLVSGSCASRFADTEIAFGRQTRREHDVVDVAMFAPGSALPTRGLEPEAFDVLGQGLVAREFIDP